MCQAQLVVPVVIAGGGFLIRISVRTITGFCGLRAEASLGHRADVRQSFVDGSVERPYSVAKDAYGLPPDLGLEWDVERCNEPTKIGEFEGPSAPQGGATPASTRKPPAKIGKLKGPSAGGAFLLAFLKIHYALWGLRCFSNPRSLAVAVAAVLVERLAVTAEVCECGGFKGVGDIEPKLKALAETKGVRMACVARSQGLPEGADQVDENLYRCRFDKGPCQIDVLKSSDADRCYRELFRLQSECVL